MSTSDAVETELRAEGGRTETRRCCAARTTRTTTAREQDDETFGSLQQRNETPTDLDCCQKVIRQEGPHTALIFGADRTRQEEAAHRVGSKVLIQKTSGPRFTTSLLLTRAKTLSFDRPGVKDSCPHSFTKPRRAETDDSHCQVNRQPSPPDTEVASDFLLLEKIPPTATREEEVITAVCNEVETTSDLSVKHSLSNGHSGPQKHNGSHILLRGPISKRTASVSVELDEDIKNHTKLKIQKDLEQLSEPAQTMLSSTVVTVLAPHWSGRIRRTKRFEAENSETQRNLQDVTNTSANRGHERFQENQSQHDMERVFASGSQAQTRVPFSGTRRNTVDWSTSGPASLDHETKKKMTQTVSLDVNTGRMDNRKLDTGALSPEATTASSLSSLSVDPSQQRRNRQVGHQGAPSSKPTTSSLLLSLRRINGRRENPSQSDHEGNLFHHSQSFLNNNEEERSKSFLSQSSISYRTNETGPVISSSSTSYRERNVSESGLFPTSPINKEAEDTTCSQQTPTCSKQGFLSSGPLARQQNCRVSEKNANQLPESTVSPPRYSPYDPSSLLKTHVLPKRATLSTSSWKQVSMPLCDDNSNVTLSNPTDNKRFSSHTPSNRSGNNTMVSVCKGNMNPVMKTQGGNYILRQRNYEDSPDHKSGKVVKQQYGLNLNNREPQRPHHLSNVLSKSKHSRTAAQITLSHPKDPNKHDVNSGSSPANVTELPPTLLNPKSSDPPTESSSKYSNNHCSSKTNSNPTSPHNGDTEKFTKQSLSLQSTNNTLNSQALTTSGLPSALNTKSVSAFHSHAVPLQTSTYTWSHTGSSSQAPKYTNTAIVTPLGFQRSLAPTPKAFPPKTVSSLIPTVSDFPKSNYTPVSSASIVSPISRIIPVTTAATSPLLLTSPATLAITSSPNITHSSLLTPPTTPVTSTSRYSEPSSPKKERTFSSGPERDSNKSSSQGEGKRLRRVTWEDSVDLQHSDSLTVDKLSPCGVPSSPLSPSRSPLTTRAPSIFSFLRSSSPTRSTSPFCSPIPKTSAIQVAKGGKYRSLSTDSPDLISMKQEMSNHRPNDGMTFNIIRPDLTMPRQERTLSVESGTAHVRSSAALSLPPDFSGGYKLRYSSTPYSTLMSSRSAQGETKPKALRSPLFQRASQSVYASQLSLNTDPGTTNTSKPPLLPISTAQTPSLPFQNKTVTRGSSHCEVSETGQVKGNPTKNISPKHNNDSILLINNRIHISSHCVPGDKEHNSTPPCVTETLVYHIKSKADTAATAQKNTTPKTLQHTANTAASLETPLSQWPRATQCKKVSGEPHSHSDQSSSGGSSAESQSHNGEDCNRRMKESALGKTRFFSMESSNEQSPKRSRFALKKSVSTPNSSLSRSDSERASKSSKKMDQVLTKLKQTFSTKRSDGHPKAPSLSGSSDISSVSDTKTLEEQEGGVMLRDNEKRAEGINRPAQNRYSIIPPSPVGVTVGGEHFPIWTDIPAPENDPNAFAGNRSESKSQVHLTSHTPIMEVFDFYKDGSADSNLTTSCRDTSPSKSPNLSSGYSSQLRKSTSSPRSPFSPFPSLSPVSPYSTPDPTDDSVFYSPKLQRRREASLPCEQGEGISLGGSRRSRASVGPPSTGPVLDKEQLASSYADLKYGIEPGRSFSVSSVLSSRPSGPGRISTGSRFMSVGDLSESSLTCGKGLNQWSFRPEGTTTYDCQPPNDCSLSHFSGEMRSRSLPRSLTRCLANWSSGVSVSQPSTAIASKPAHHWSPNMNSCHFGWETEGPPTPPPTPPLSPVSRRMSKPSSLSSPTSPTSPGAPQLVDNQSSRARLPSRGYISSLSTFEESSDSSSDTTTDDEYYLETGEGEEKETEL